MLVLQLLCLLLLLQLKGGEDDVDDERDQGTETGWKMVRGLAENKVRHAAQQTQL